MYIIIALIIVNLIACYLAIEFSDKLKDAIKEKEKLISLLNSTEDKYKTIINLNNELLNFKQSKIDLLEKQLEVNDSIIVEISDNNRTCLILSNKLLNEKNRLTKELKTFKEQVKDLQNTK